MILILILMKKIWKLFKNKIYSNFIFLFEIENELNLIEFEFIIFFEIKYYYKIFLIHIIRNNE